MGEPGDRQTLMQTKTLAFLLFTLLVLAVAPSRAEDKVVVDLYLAQSTPPRPEAKLAGEIMEHRLHEVFGFTYYELIAEHEIDLAKHWEQWAVPRKDFFIRVEPLPRQPDEPQVVAYEIYKDGFIVARGKYEPRAETPLFINGPDFKQGRFIFVLEAR